MLHTYVISLGSTSSPARERCKLMIALFLQRFGLVQTGKQTEEESLDLESEAAQLIEAFGGPLKRFEVQYNATTILYIAETENFFFSSPNDRSLILQTLKERLKKLGVFVSIHSAFSQG